LSSAILYIAIVAIWAFVLIPRWLRRPHLLGGENAEPEELDGSDTVTEDYEEQEPEWDDRAPAYQRQPQPRRAPSAYVAPPLPRSRVLQARRRLLTMLVTLTAAAGACTALRLTPWWVCVPPAVMLGAYLLLLREAALADYEQAGWRAAEAQEARAAREFAQAERMERSAQVIDISDRLSDQLYDQYADATMRAVGD
jgi:hypothetical protein